MSTFPFHAWVGVAILIAVFAFVCWWIWAILMQAKKSKSMSR